MRTSLERTLSFLFLVLLIVSACSAQLNMCNETGHSLRYYIVGKGTNGWFGRGFQNLDSGTCKNAYDSPLPRRNHSALLLCGVLGSPDPPEISGASR